MEIREKQRLREKLKKTCPLFFSTFAEAKVSQKKILEACQQYDAVYLIIREEGDMDDASLLSLHKAVKVYAGVAWTQIHKARLEEGLYASTAD